MRRLLVLATSLAALAVFAVAGASAESPGAAVEEVLAAYRSALPAAEDLTVYTLDWSPTLDEARRRASREGRPILLAIVTNSYGDLFSGHC